MSDRAIRSVIVLGGGIVGLSAAAAFARTLPGVAVTVIETPPDPRALTERLPGSRPGIARFHRLIGVEEADLIADGAATWRIGTRFRNWSASGADWIDFTGECGPRIGTIGFHHFWARAARSGEARPYHAYAAAGALADADRFVLPVADPGSPFASYDYALRIVPDRYRVMLALLCGRLGVTRVEGAFADAERDGTGAIAAVMLGDGHRVSGDLYIDCGGVDAPLLHRVGCDFEDWGASLPACRVGIEAEAGEPGAVDAIERTEAGWRWHSPGAGGGQVVGADAVLPGSVAVRPGRQRTPWLRNVVAVGDAALALDPLNWMGLDAAHTAIELALELLPNRDFHPVELAEYNRRVAMNALAARDFSALFYCCPNGPEGGFWRRASALEMPDSVAAAVEQFRRRGYLPPNDVDATDSAGRIAALAGLGHLPDSPDALAAAIPAEITNAAMARWAEGLAAVATQLPSYRDYLANTRRGLR